MLRLKIGVTLFLVAFPPILAAVCPLSRSETGGIAQSGESITVLVARENLAFETVFDEPAKYAEEKSIPSVDAPKRCLHSIDAIKDMTLARNVPQGDCITEDHIWNLKARGQVACTIPVGRAPGAFTGAHRPLAWVSVYLRPLPETDTSPPRLIIGRVLILAVDYSNDREADKRPLDFDVTFAVFPQQAEQLKKAVSQGELYLVYGVKNEDTLVDPGE